MKYDLNNWRVPLADLKNDNRKPEILDEFAVESSSRDVVHAIRKIQYLTKPFEEADVTADTDVLWVCSCEDTQYNRWGKNGGVPRDYTPCKHITKHFKSVRAAESDSQATL